MISTDHSVVHKRFMLNGFHLDRDDLCRVAYSFIKEGDDFERPVGGFLLDWFDNNDYIEMQTSGSTGIPKIIRVKKQAMVHSAIASGVFLGLEPGDKALHCLPVKYVAGKMMFVRAFVLGLDMDFVKPGLEPLRNNSTDYSFSAMVPLQAWHSIDKLNQVKKLIVGGAKISVALEKKLRKLNNDCYETFGMTETVSHIAAKKVGRKSFKAMPDVDLSLDDRGCLVINAPKISENLIVTNDLVELINNHEFSWKGRIDNVINSGGVKLIPEQIEEKLAKKIDRRFFIAGIPDPVLGQKVVLVVEGDAYELDATIFSGLDKFEVPKDIKFVAQFKETGNGKIIRHASME